MKSVKTKCSVCGDIYIRYRYQINKGIGLACSRDCDTERKRLAKVGKYDKAKFAKWVHTFGGSLAVAEAVGVTQQSVIYWISNETMPRADKALEMIKLSKGKLTLSDIVGK